MSTPPDRTPSRAEARRRARLAARGELADEPPESTETDADEARGGFLSRLFPPAPPLPNMPPPLAGFDESGPLRPVRERLFLLRRNPIAWVATGLVAAVGNYTTLLFGPTDVFSFLGTMLRFGALIAAGWIGWQRPPLYGTAAAILSFLIFVVAILVSPAVGAPGLEVFTQEGAASQLLVEGVFQTALGFLAGWYGGYLRRRQSQVTAQRSRTTRRR
jgi:hypothetical protein